MEEWLRERAEVLVRTNPRFSALGVEDVYAILKADADAKYREVREKDAQRMAARFSEITREELVHIFAEECVRLGHTEATADAVMEAVTGRLWSEYAHLWK